MDDSPRQLSRLQRLTANGVAAALGLLGAVAVFTTDNEAGTAVLLGTALVLFAIGGLGFVPQRLKIGETEVDLATTVLTRTLDSARGDVAAEVAADVVEVAQQQRSLPSDAKPLVAKARTVLYETTAADTLLDLLPPGVNAQLGLVGEPDMLLWQGERRVAVVLSYLGRAADPARRLREAKAKALHWAANGGFHGVLVVTDRAADFTLPNAPVPVFHGTTADVEGLSQALRQALDGAVR